MADGAAAAFPSAAARPRGFSARARFPAAFFALTRDGLPRPFPFPLLLPVPFFAVAILGLLSLPGSTGKRQWLPVAKRSMHGRARLVGQILVKHFGIQVYAAAPGHRVRHRIERYPAEDIRVGERAVGLGCDELAEIDAAFEAVVEAHPERVILLGAALHDGVQAADSAAAVTPVEQAHSQRITLLSWLSFRPCDSTPLLFYRVSIPAQRTSGLVLGDTGFEEILLFLEVYHLGHPRKRIRRTVERLVEPDLLAAAV